MKKFIVINIALLIMSTHAWACGDFGNNHNNYMFSVFRREMMNSELYADRINAFWKTYTNGAADSYLWNKEIVKDAAKKKGDQEMLSYLKQLDTYLDISDQLQETWDYPTKEQLRKRQQDLNTIVQQSAAYKGTRLKPQWQLLRMRANMVLGKHPDNIDFWEKTGKRMPESVYRDMMNNIYAGALLHTGRRTEACNIYAEQGDMLSIKWAMRKIRNLGGIRTIYDENPNSATMNFLVQDFVNNAQETLDSNADKEWLEETIDARLILKKEVDSFIDYAKNVVSNKNTPNPALWMAAVGELQFLYGHYNDAMTTLNKAVGMEGTQRMKDNARAIRMVASVKPATLGQEYSQWMTGEMKWLLGKIKEEGGNEEQLYYNHYYDILDRLVYSNLVPKYKESGRTDMAAALISMMESQRFLKMSSSLTGNPFNYYNDYFIELDQMTPEQLIAHSQFIQSRSNDPLEQFVKDNIEFDNNYFNDLIGTKYLAYNQFDKACDFLGKVPLKFMEQQNISYYLAHRDYTKPRWIEKQAANQNENTDGPGLGKLSSNPKLNFCKEMIQLKNDYSKSSGEKKAQLAYDLATRYLQASYLGDCWYLTNYGKSVNDTARADRPDFAAMAVNYLNESAKSNNGLLRINSLYGLAYIPIEPWCNTDYDWDNNRDIITPLRTNRQYKALNELNNYLKKVNIGLQPEYVRKCDVLKQFRKFV